MSLVNYTLPFGGVGASNWATHSPIQTNHATAVNNLLYGPAGHQESDPIVDQEQYYKNSPYSPPQQASNFRSRNNYLPPPPSQPRQFNTQQPATPPQTRQQYPQQLIHQLPPPQQPPQQPSRTYIDSSYSQNPSRDDSQYYNNNNYNNRQNRPYTQQPVTVTPPSPITTTPPSTIIDQNGLNDPNKLDPNNPLRPPGFTRVQAGQGSRTQVHAILDYDDDSEYYDDGEDQSSNDTPGNQKSSMPTVTPIQGPIFLKNGTVPVVPLFAYPTLNNGSFVQIPIWWTALSVALGLDIRGDVIRGVPCVKRFHQLFCPTAGNSYPIDRIEQFIDDNKALMRRMYGDFEMTSRYGPPKQDSKQRKRNVDDGFDYDMPGIPDWVGVPGQEPERDVRGGVSIFNNLRSKRQAQSFRGSGPSRNQQSQRQTQTSPPKPQTAATANSGSSINSGSSTSSSSSNNSNNNNPNDTGRLDACESKVEIVTPYWASNSAGKIRAIVNTQHFEQAIHQEVCSKVQTNRCSGDCGCEQKYKWHRLLAYDPDNDCKGIFMDWFLFPSCCVCRCDPL